MKKVKVIFVLATVALLNTQCKKEETTPVTVDPLVLRMTTTLDLAYDNSTQTDPICFLDLDSAHVFSVSNAQAHAAEIDLVYVLRNTNANDPMFISMGNFDGQVGYPISSWDKTTLGINQFTAFNHITIDPASSQLTSTAFASITKLSQLKGYVGSGPSTSDFEQIDPSHIGNMYAFRTQQGKVGAFRVIDCQNGSSGFAQLEIIIQQ
ncbi:MAG: hypothetical protein IT221_04095 [Fluviicola sp.]|nr:hypothetical protein [Fluviicola sp.]